ncbi:ATPase V [Enterococcus sp. LJL120]
MNAIEKIIEEMNQQAAAENSAYETAEKAKIDQQHATELAQLQEDFEKQKTRQLAAIDSKYRQLKNRQQVTIRQQSLQEKQEFLSSLFTRSAQKMAEWSPDEAHSFAAKALKQLPLKNTAIFMAGELSPYYSADWLEQINQTLPYQLTMAPEKLAKKAGFIVDDQGVQYNFIFENLIKDLQSEVSFEIAQQLFN